MIHKVTVANERQYEALQKVSKRLDYNVSLAISLAINEMHNTFIYMRERRDLFRGEVKMCFNKAFSEAQKLETSIKSYMIDKKFWTDYSDKVIDLLADDVLHLRIAIKQALDKDKVEDSNLISQIGMTWMLLRTALESYNDILAEGRRSSGRDFSKDFGFFKTDKILYWWDRMSEKLFGAVPLSAERESIQRAYDVLCQKLFSEECFNECLAEARHNNPDFVGHQICSEKR